MDFKLARPNRCALAIGWRAVALAALSYGVISLLTQTQLYATAVVLAGVAILIGVDVARVIGRVAHSMEQDLERLAVVGSDIPVAGLNVAGLDEVSRVTEPFERAASILGAARAERQQQLEYLQTLLDTVAAALIVVDEEGHVTLANRAARGLAAQSSSSQDAVGAQGGGGTRHLTVQDAGVPHLTAQGAGGAPHLTVQGVGGTRHLTALGLDGARQLMTLAPGAREIVSLADGRRVFVAVSQFSVPGGPAQRLLSLQRIAGDLDAVELKAWQDMADVLTHEMMNSLTPIASLSESLETLLRGHSEEDVAGAVEAIKRRSRGLMDFVGRYRAVAELPAPATQRVRMDELLRGIERLLAPIFREKGVAYRRSVSPDDLACVADPQLLEQAVINLLRNAADAVAEVEAPRVDVTCEQRDDRMVMTIADNGCGVPDARREKIFVPFFTTKTGGSGIGLSLARHIVLAHGGQLDVRGAVFTVTLPAAQQN
jgi:signal transduction histidine kinase